jgi:hypothetical protein
MKLNKTLREQILASVMKATDHQQRIVDLRNNTSNALRAILVTKLPDGFLEKTKNLPAEWFAHVTSSFYREGKNFEFEPLRCPLSFTDNLYSDPEGVVLIETFTQENERLVNAEYETQREVYNFLASCGTTEQVLKAFPQFERHLPNGSVTYPISAGIGRVSAILAGCGFDTTLKAA